ncbi:GTPase HflX [Extensimonas sp. H3M7-6]|uniref:GTPase HflX n=1 Tax=Extensimonas soli TaxID=3031322 RepID=UPI00387E76FE
MRGAAAAAPADAAPVLLVGVDFGLPHFDHKLEELGLLAETAGMQPVARLVCKRKAPDAALFVGSGKAEEIRTLAHMYGAGEVLFDQSLSPAQQRNLEQHLGLPVNDRTLLILEIFAQRARSHEGKLQVELARLQYLSTRLVRRWSHLERQRGGIGARGGPGETQIELDRRMIGQAILRTKERLAKVKRQRATQRRQRARRDTFNISLVGYTNAGKSTLFNALVKAQAYAANQLFATLDTTTRQLYLADAGRSVSLSDTVGFIRDLPHGLVDAFEATLQEAVDADLLLHVVDAANPHFPEQIAQVERVLADIGAAQVPQLLVFNKLDALAPEQRPAALQDVYERAGQPVERIFVSARTGEGLELLRAQLARTVLAAGAAGSEGPEPPDAAGECA